MPISSGANPWPKSYWTKPVEKEVTLPPKRERASIAEGFAEKRRRFFKQRSVPVLSYKESSIFARPGQLTSHSPSTTLDEVWEDEKQVMAVPSYCSSSSVFSSKHQAAVEPFCSADDPSESQRSVCPSSGVETKRRKEDAKTEEDDAEKGRTRHTLSITENRGSVGDDDDDRWRCSGCGRGRARGMAARRFCCWRGGWWGVVVLLTMIVLTTAAVIALTLILMAGRRLSDGYGMETASSSSTERTRGRWIDDVFFYPASAAAGGGGGGGGDDDDAEQLYAKLYLQKQSTWKEPCFNQSTSYNETLGVTGSCRL